MEGEHLTLDPGEGEAGGDALGPGLGEEEGLGGAAPPQQPQGQPAGCPVLGGANPAPIKDQVWGLVLL